MTSLFTVTWQINYNTLTMSAIFSALESAVWMRWIIRIILIVMIINTMLPPHQCSPVCSPSCPHRSPGSWSGRGLRFHTQSSDMGRAEQQVRPVRCQTLETHLSPTSWGSTYSRRGPQSTSNGPSSPGGHLGSLLLVLNTSRSSGGERDRRVKKAPEWVIRVITTLLVVIITQSYNYITYSDEATCSYMQ